MGKNISTFIFTILISLPLAANEKILRAGSDYQISIPADWVEIPRDILNQYQASVKATTGQNITYEYGYQSSSAVGWFEHPYALVQVKRIGRVPEGQLKKYKKIESGFKEGIDKLEKSAGDFLKNMTMGEPIYDENKHILWSAMSMEVTGVGKVKGIIAVKLTEFGVVQFMGYAKDENFSRHEPAYRKMIHSITVNQSDIYKPRITDNSPTVFGINLWQVLITGMIGGLIGGIFCLFKYFAGRGE